jgi:succinate-acetate transporter protein
MSSAPTDPLDRRSRHVPAMAAAGDPAAMATRIILRPIATPFPLGFSALATASLLVACSELGWLVSGADRRLIALALISFAVPLQLLACIFGFLGRDTSAATTFGVQAGSWLVIGIASLQSAPGSVSHALGVLLCAAAAWVALCALGSALGKLVPAAVLALVSLRFLLTGLYELTASRTLEHAAGIVGLVLVAACAYAILAMEIESLQRRTVLPLLRRGLGAVAMDQSLLEQSQRIEHEPGVREQL